MPLMPKRVKYRKLQKGNRRGVATSGAELGFGEFGLKSLENGWLKDTQIEAARVILARQLHKGGKLWIRIFPDKSITKKPAEVRMGKGKGNVEYYVAVVKPGRMMIEVGGMSTEEALKALKMAQYKFSIRTKIVTRHEAVAGE